MKKVLFTSMVLLSVLSWTGNVYAQDAEGGTEGTETPATAQAKVTFTPSADGKTLTISGQGDLTTLTTTDYSARVFTDKAVGFVFADDKGTKVNENDSYNSAKTYYQAEYSYSLLYSGVPKAYTNGFKDVNTSYSWKDESKLANLYAINWNNDGKIGVGAKVDVSATPNTSKQWTLGSHENLAYYIVSENDIANSTLTPSDYSESSDWQIITFSDFMQQYVTVNVTYSISENQSLYVKHNSSENYEALVANKSYSYADGDQFFKREISYAQIDNNDAFFGKDGEHSDYIQADPKELSFNDLLTRKILEGVAVYDYDAQKNVGENSTYTTVKFVNTGSTPLYIDADVVRAILYPKYNGVICPNLTTLNLDLGEATLNDLDENVFIPTSETYKLQKLVLNEITFPKTKLTSVYSASTKQNEDKMVLPAKVISYLAAKIKTITIPEGYDRIADEAFAKTENSVLSNVNLPKGLTLIGKHAFLNCSEIKSIDLNEGLENIGEEAFYGTSLTAVKFPSSLKIINDCAFAGCHIMDLKFNAGLRYIGNSAFALSEKQTESVLEIPASVIYIGPYAFNFRQYQDVYFYGKKAPLMPLGNFKADVNTKDLGTAFPQHTLNGNNGFDPLPKEGEEVTGDATNLGYANRENYKNHGVYLCMLHYPKDLEDDERDTYTDITRVYKTYRTEDGKFFATNTGADEATDKVGEEDKDGELDSGLCHSYVRVNWGYADTYLGEQYIWPSHTQFNRAYCTASNSVKWDGVTPVTCELSEDEIAALKYAGYDTSKENLDKLKKIAHMGTRQFVLANADVNVDENPDEEPEYPIDVKGGQWWTLCVPFNMTKAMVDETFGPGTEVCLFDRVSRQVNRNTQTNRIILYFTQNVYKHKTAQKNSDGTWNFSDSAEAPADDDIVIYAHEAYMIHPAKTDADAVFVVKNYTPVVGNPTPTVVVGKNTYIGESDIPDNVPYRYVGNYLLNVDAAAETQIATQAAAEVKVPRFSYVYAKAKGDKSPKFWFITGDKMVWKPNKCVVQTNNRGAGENDFEEFFESNASGAKQASFFGEDFSDSTTSIEDEMVIIAGEGSDAAVYRLDGTLVNTTGDMTGLAKGIYIKGGKKYVVK